jgi:hypothetical protein
MSYDPTKFPPPTCEKCGRAKYDDHDCQLPRVIIGAEKQGPITEDEKIELRALYEQAKRTMTPEELERAAEISAKWKAMK